MVVERTWSVHSRAARPKCGSAGLTRPREERAGFGVAAVRARQPLLQASRRRARLHRAARSPRGAKADAARAFTRDAARARRGRRSAVTAAHDRRVPPADVASGYQNERDKLTLKASPSIEYVLRVHHRERSEVQHAAIVEGPIYAEAEVHEVVPRDLVVSVPRSDVISIVQRCRSPCRSWKIEIRSKSGADSRSTQRPP